MDNHFNEEDKANLQEEVKEESKEEEVADVWAMLYTDKDPTYKQNKVEQTARAPSAKREGQPEQIQSKDQNENYKITKS